MTDNELNLTIELEQTRLALFKSQEDYMKASQRETVQRLRALMVEQEKREAAKADASKQSKSPEPQPTA